MNRIERFAVRCCLSAIVVGMSIAFAPFMLLLKLVEGVWLASKITADSLRQLWGPEGLPAWLAQRAEDRIRRAGVRE